MLTACLAVPAALAQESGSRGRLMPPPSLVCERNQLTSATGVVENWRHEGEHEAEVVWLRIATDEGTLEELQLAAGAGSVEDQFLLGGGPFSAADWARIESTSGALKAGVRVTAWICLDGVTPPVLDWQPAPD